MYNFIFWFFYKYFEWKDGTKSVFLCSNITCLSMLFHIGLIYSIIRYITGFNVGMFTEHYVIDKLLLLPFVLLFFLLIYFLYFKKKSEFILREFGDRKVFTTVNIIKVVALVVLPIVFAAIITNQAVTKWK